MSNIISTKELLKASSNQELEPLVGYIKEASVSEWLTINDLYKNNHPNHSRYVNLIYKEICLFGGNTFANIFRGGEGPAYFEIVKDVACKIKIKNIDSYKTVLELEEVILQELFRKAMREAGSENQEDIEQLFREQDFSYKDYSSFLSGSSLATLLSATMYRAVIARISIIVANSFAKQILGTGLSYGAALLLGRSASLLLGPIGLIAATIWTATDIAGPAYRVTTPCVVHIAMLRQKWICESSVSELKGVFNDKY